MGQDKGWRARLKRRTYEQQRGLCLHCATAMVIKPGSPLNATFWGGRTKRQLVHQKCQNRGDDK